MSAGAGVQPGRRLGHAAVATLLLAVALTGARSQAARGVPSATPGRWIPTASLPVGGFSKGVPGSARLLDGRVLRVQQAPTLTPEAATLLYRPTVGGGTWDRGAPSPYGAAENMVLIEGPGCEPHCGRVLVQFQYVTSTDSPWALFDPATGGWLPVSFTSRNHSVGGAATVLLTGSPERCAEPAANCGKVLVVGGGTDKVQPACDEPPLAASGLKRAELWDPATGLWTEVAGDTAVKRGAPDAVQLADGRVLVLGGARGVCPGSPNERLAEVFDPRTGTWSPAGYTDAHSLPQLVRLPGSDLVLAIGRGATAIFDPSAPPGSEWRSVPHCGYVACGWPVVLPTGKVLTAGGEPTFSSSMRQAFLFDPATETWAQADPLGSDYKYYGLPEHDNYGSFTLLEGSPDQCGQHCGKVLAAGGGPDGNLAELYTPGPAVEGIRPVVGPTTGGTTVTISGRYFDAGATVAFGDAPAEVLDVDPGGRRITARSPAHDPGPVHVRVTTEGGTSDETPLGLFTYLPPPVVSAVDPPLGPASGGTAVRISGTGFDGATSVTFGGVPAASFRVASDSTAIDAVTPPHDPGPVPVVVTTSGGGASAVPGAPTFTYGPLITGLFPAKGPTLGGTTVSIGGKGLARATTAVRFGDVPASFSIRSDTEITAVSPARATPGTVVVQLTTIEGLVSVPAVPGGDVYTYVEPEPLVDPGPPAGGGGGGLDRQPVSGQPEAPGGGAGGSSPAPAPAPIPSASPGVAPGAAPAPGPAPGAAPGSAAAAVPSASPAASPGAGPAQAPSASATSAALPAAGPAPVAAAAPASSGAGGQSAGAGGNSGVGAGREDDRGATEHAMVRRDEEVVGGWAAAALVLVAGCVALGAPRPRRRGAPGASRPGPKTAY